MSFFANLGAGLLTSVVDAGLGFIGADRQNKYNMQMAQYQNAYNRRMAEYQNDWNLSMWNRQNEYNSPKATVKRLVEAGINPRTTTNLGPFANASGSPQAEGYPSVAMQKVSELSAFQDVTRKGLENALLREELDKREAQTGNILSQTSLNHASKSLQKAREHLANEQAGTEFSKRSYYSAQTGYMYKKEFLTLFQALVFAAENGINPDDFHFGPQTIDENGKHNGSVFQRQGIATLLSTYTDRLGYKLASEKFGALLRQFEALTKEDRYNMLKEFGLDTDASDSLMALARWFLRVFGNEFE